MEKTIEKFEQIYKCEACGKETSEFALIGRRDEDNYFALFCECGSKNLKIDHTNK